jgi:hypothetical protein
MSEIKCSSCGQLGEPWPANSFCNEHCTYCGAEFSIVELKQAKGLFPNSRYKNESFDMPTNNQVIERIKKAESLTAIIHRLEVENAKLRAGLAFYADKNNWSYYDMYSWSTGDSSPKGDIECLENDGSKSKLYGGKLARQILREVE